jgi:hypothetical protein
MGHFNQLTIWAGLRKSAPGGRGGSRRNMKYLKIKRFNARGSYIQPMGAIQDIIDSEFSDSEIGDRIILELVEMTEDEYNKIPEFMGW